MCSVLISISVATGIVWLYVPVRQYGLFKSLNTESGIVKNIVI